MLVWPPAYDIDNVRTAGTPVGNAAPIQKSVRIEMANNSDLYGHDYQPIKRTYTDPNKPDFVGATGKGRHWLASYWIPPTILGQPVDYADINFAMSWRYTGHNAQTHPNESVGPMGYLFYYLSQAEGDRQGIDAAMHPGWNFSEGVLPPTYATGNAVDSIEYGMYLPSGVELGVCTIDNDGITLHAANPVFTYLNTLRGSVQDHTGSVGFAIASYVNATTVVLASSAAGRSGHSFIRYNKRFAIVMDSLQIFEPLSKPYVMFSFDCGYRSQLAAIQYLRGRGLIGTVYMEPWRTAGSGAQHVLPVRGTSQFLALSEFQDIASYALVGIYPKMGYTQWPDKTNAQKMQDSLAAQNYHRANGLGPGWAFMSTLGSGWTEWDQINLLGPVWATLTGSPGANGYACFSGLVPNILPMSVAANASLAVRQASIATAVATNSVSHQLWHFVDGGTFGENPIAGNTWDDFVQTVEYAITQGCTCVTPLDFCEGRVV